jgi:hypothetical protein
LQFLEPLLIMGINSGSKTAADNTYQQRFPT